MSYDLQLVLIQPGDDPLEVAMRDVEGEAAPLTPEARVRIERVVAALLRLDSAWKRFDTDSHVELTAPAGVLQVTFFVDSGGLSIPYGRGPITAAIGDYVGRCLGILANEGGYVIVDTQAETVLSPDSWSAVLFQRCDAAVAIMSGNLERRPWWKFWQR